MRKAGRAYSTPPEKATQNMDNLVLPGQPVPLAKGPIPKLGSGIYARDDLLRSSLVGFPHNSGPVGTLR